MQLTRYNISQRKDIRTSYLQARNGEDGYVEMKSREIQKSKSNVKEIIPNAMVHVKERDIIRRTVKARATRCI